MANSLNWTSSLTVWVCLLFTLQYGLAEQTPTSPPTNIPLPTRSPLPFDSGRLFSISSEGIMTKILRSDDDFVKSTKLIQDYVTYIEKDTLNFLLRSKAPLAHQALRPCNFEDEPVQSSMKYFLNARNLPELDTTCITEFKGTHTLPEKEPPFTTNEIYETVVTRANAVLANAKNIADEILGNWTSPDVNVHYMYNTTSKRCVINHIGSMRIQKNWYIFTTITNAPRRLSLPLFRRQWLDEFIHVNDDGKLGEPLHFPAPKRPEGDGEHILINDTTTTLASSRGAGGPYAFISMYTEENPALMSASDDSDLSIQQADDALAPSSLAILLLPLALNLVPVAILADVTTSVMLIYAVMTDIITVIPLGIKGVELIIIGKQRHRSVVMRLTSSVNGTLTDSAVMEMWAAQCRSRDSIYVVGIVFLSVALIFMVLGIVLEFVVQAIVQRRKLVRNLILFESEPLVHSLPSEQLVSPSEDVPTHNTASESSDNVEQPSSSNVEQPPSSNVEQPPSSEVLPESTATTNTNNVHII